MQLRKAWARFFVCVLLIIGMLSIIMMIVFYNVSSHQEAIRRESIENFVHQQKLESITNIVNNMVTEINIQATTAEENAALDLERAFYSFSIANVQSYPNDSSINELIRTVGALNKNVDILAYNMGTGRILGLFGGEPVETAGSRHVFDHFFDDWAAMELYEFDNRYLIGFGVKKHAVHDALLDSMQKYVDSQVPLGDVEIRIDALHNYYGHDDFATRIIVPFFQRSGKETVIHAGNADYFDTLELLVRNGSSVTEFMPEGELDRLIYARLYRPYDWVVSASISAKDIQQLTHLLAAQFMEQQRSTMLILAVTCLPFIAAALWSFVMLGQVFFQRTDNEFKIIDNLAQIDALTGIYNRRFMESELNSVLELLSRSNGTLSILMIDIDHFKLYNDTYGHQQGDVCLKNVAQALSETISRTNDFVARYGGEEFIAVLPNTGEFGARLIAEKLLENIIALNIPHEKSSVAPYVTISIGAASGIVEHTQRWEDYVKRADEAVYKSKKDGRNRYTYVAYRPYPQEVVITMEVI